MACSWWLSMQASPDNCCRETQKQKHLSYFFNLFVLVFFFFYPFFKFHSFYLSAERQTEQHEAHFTVGLTDDWSSLNRNPHSKTLADSENMWDFSWGLGWGGGRLWSQISTDFQQNELPWKDEKKWDSSIPRGKAWKGHLLFIFWYPVHYLKVTID